MKSIPMSAPMVLAILANRKRQTRRLSKPKHGPGDLLYVREAWRVSRSLDPLRPSQMTPRSMSVMYEAGGSSARTSQFGPFEHDPTWPKIGEFPDWAGRPRAAMFMPAWASRITLKVTAVRQEPLHAITVADAIAEGLAAITKDGKLVKYGIPDADGEPGTDNFGWEWVYWRMSPVDAYARLWNIINGDGAWEKNPDVWVTEFERLS